MLVLVKVCCHVGMWTSAARCNVKFQIMRCWSPGCLLPQNSMPTVYSLFVPFRITAHFPYYIRFFVSITCTYPLRRSPSKLACVCWCFWASTSAACISMPDMVRHDICPHNYAVGRWLVVGFCSQPYYCNWPYYPTARFQSPSSYMVSVEQFLDRSRPMLCKLAQMGSHPITFLWPWPATDHEPRGRHLSINTIWRRTECTQRSRWWRSYGWNLQWLQQSWN